MRRVGERDYNEMEKILVTLLIVLSSILYLAECSVIDEIFVPGCLNPDAFAITGNKRPHMDSLTVEGKESIKCLTILFFFFFKNGWKACTEKKCRPRRMLDCTKLFKTSHSSIQCFA